jgi:hypothetical protein
VTRSAGALQYPAVAIINQQQPTLTWLPYLQHTASQRLAGKLDADRDTAAAGSGLQWPAVAISNGQLQQQQPAASSS